MTNKDMAELIFVLFLCLPLANGQTYKGFQFLDNLLPARFGPENGYADYILDIESAPDQVLGHNNKFKLSNPNFTALNLL